MRHNTEFMGSIITLMIFAVIMVCFGMFFAGLGIPR